MQPMIREERTVIDLMNEGTLDTTVEYYEQTTFTNAAAETAESATKPEGALAWTLRTSTARDIAHWIPMTKQSIRDNAFLEPRSAASWCSASAAARRRSSSPATATRRTSPASSTRRASRRRRRAPTRRPTRCSRR
jgi:hypothetical protein